MTLIISPQVLAVPNELVDVPALLPALRKCLEIGLTYVFNCLSAMVRLFMLSL